MNKLTISLLLGVCSWQLIPFHISTYMASFCLLAAILLHIKYTKLNLKLIILFIFGLLWLNIHFNNRLSAKLPHEIYNKSPTITGVIKSIPINKPSKTIALLYIRDSSAKELINKNILITFKSIDLNLNNNLYFAPGDYLNTIVKIKPIRGYANKGSFNIEKFYFLQNIQAKGFVSPNAKVNLIKAKPLSTPIESIRYKIANFFLNNLNEKEHKGIIIALGIGEKAYINPETIEKFKKTGTSHILAISGLHIGLIALVGVLLTRICYMALPILGHFVPRVTMEALCGFFLATFYALISGMQVPATRALIMLLVFMGARILRKTPNRWNCFFLALMIVIIINPLSTMTASFWLSFTAVGILLYGLGNRVKPKGFIWKYIHPHMVMFIGLMPLSLLLFNQTSIISPIANLLIIPIFCFTTVPLILLAVLFIPVSSTLAITFTNIAYFFMELAYKLIEALLNITVVEISVNEVGVWSFVLSIIAAVIVLLPKGVRGKSYSVILFLPIFFQKPQNINHGDFIFTQLDVGQGLATVIRTAGYTIVYDAGPKYYDFDKNKDKNINMQDLKTNQSTEYDLGRVVVVPYLKSIGVKSIERLIISHMDNDHSGGANYIFNNILTKEVITSEPKKVKFTKASMCYKGLSFNLDGVNFEFLHPNKRSNKVNENYRLTKSKKLTKKLNKNIKINDLSCVLKVSNNYKSVLLTGDITKDVERQLINYYKNTDKLRADILLAPHHGSKTSSSLEFINAVSPQYVLISAGYLNRYNHPNIKVLKRYNDDKNLTVLSSIDYGGVEFYVDRGVTLLKYYRDYSYY